MNCTRCNTPLTQSDAFCPRCGEPVYVEQQQPVYANAYNNVPARKNNAGLIVAVIVAVVAVLVAIVAFVIMVVKPDRAPVVPPTTEIVYQAPVFDYAEGSTTRGYDVDTSVNQRVYYYSDYAIDDDMTTAWTPNRNTDPVPSITLHAYNPQRVSGIRMTNGYCKSEKTYTKNKRISKVRVTYNGGETIAEFGMNHYREMLDVPFGRTVETDYITIQVLDAYYGTWQDIAISEIDVY